jgi:hypothetical protein
MVRGTVRRIENTTRAARLLGNKAEFDRKGVCVIDSNRRGCAL